MTRTFLVELELGSESDLIGMALDLKDDLETAGWDVKSVKPWAGKTLGPVASPVVLPPGNLSLG